MTKTVESVLQSAAETITQRRAIYGSNEQKVGAVLAILFEDGVSLQTPEDHRMFHMVGHIVGKLTRFANSGLKDTDSMHDIIGYAALAEVEVDAHDIGVYKKRPVVVGQAGTLRKEYEKPVNTAKPTRGAKRRV